ncbi:MAG: hypothetical protein JXR55_00810 [Candidatus Fermentibacteraceae bacterium]|nr:hypothetical protein [Candidatus Fermentibacteraceae bacterium]
MKPVILIALMLITASAAVGEDITFQFSLEQDQVQVSRWMEWDVVSIPGGVVPFQEGEPSLQGIPYTFAIPQGTSISEVSLDVQDRVVLPGRFELAPVSYSILSHPFEAARPSAVYFSRSLFPSDPVGTTNSGNRSGFRLGSFVLVPFSYDPVSGELSVILSAIVTVKCDQDGEAVPLTLTERQLNTAAQAVGSIVRNPEMLPAWSPELRSDTDSDPVWVAIGDSSMAGILQPLVDHRNLYTGESQFVTVDFITDNYSGYDTPERIRNYLKDQYNNHSLIYALIVGDYGETTRISSLVYGSSTLDNVTDHYYIDLDSTWDADGDHLYGEVGDGINYYSDLYVGRFCSDNTAYVGNMVEKTIAYETTSPQGDWRTTAMLAGAGLWPPDYWGSFVCQDIAGYIPSGWTVEKLYENMSGHPNNQIDIINDGCSFSAIQGHGNWAGIYWYDYEPTEIIATTNYGQMHNIDMLTVFHSMACMAGELTQGASIAERLMLSPLGGSIAVMFNSSYGWGTPPSRGPSEWLEVTFAEQLFSFGVDRIGVTQCNAKDAIQPLTYVPLINWVTQENNLLGDPALTFITGQTGIEGGLEQGPALPMLHVPSPNPTRSGCSIAYDIPVSGEFSMTLYDISGRAVRRLHSGLFSQGSGSIAFDGRDSSGNPLPPGVYSIVMSGQSGQDAVTMVISR